MDAIANPAPRAIVVRDLARRFGDRPAVDGLSFEVAEGETFGLLGHNGAGKTTTIRLLNGVLDRDAGEVDVLGFDPALRGVDVRARTGVLTETPSVDERLTATENLVFYGRLYGLVGRDLDDRVHSLLDAFGLADRAAERVGGYSRGMKQRVALARTLLHDPDILFLDEPTAALDPAAAREVHDLIEGFRGERRRTVVLTTHNLVEAGRLCDRVAIMQHGRAVAVGSPEELSRSVRVATTVRIEVAPAQREVALGLIAATGAEVLTERDGLGVHIASREEIPALVAALVTAGVRVYHVADEPPDLEDAYFSIVGAAAQPPEAGR